MALLWLLLLLQHAFTITAFPSVKSLLREADEAAVVWPWPDPLPPSIDPWYRAPYGWDSTDPGQVLKIRHAPRLNQTVGNALTAYQVLYRTTDSNYEPSWAVTTVFIPLWQYRCTVAAPALCAHALLSYQIPYDSASVDSSPSYTLHAGEPYGEISDALFLGWFVSVPDYEGPLASYAAGVQSGHATLDGVRAVLAVAGFFGLQLPRARIALWGYSGGSIASEWAAELAVQYAPRLAITGMALGGLCPNVTSIAYFLNRSQSAGLLPAALLGITSQHPPARQWLLSRLKPSGATTFLTSQYLSAPQVVGMFSGQNIFDYFVGGVWDVVGAAPMRAAFDTDGYMGYHGVPKMPIFVYKAVADQVSAVQDTDALVDKYCGVGANILYHRNMLGAHNAELVNGRSRAFAFLSSILDGTYPQAYQSMGCAVVNVSISVTPTVEWD